MFIKKRISIVSKTTLLLLVFVFSFVNLAPLALAAPADATTEAECQTENGFWDGTTCTDPTATADDNNSCEESAGDFSFILCPTLYALDAAIGALDGIVTGLLTIDFDRLEYSDGLKNAWGAVRNLAYVILIPMLLLMVIGTALGFKFLDAYTVKRALPRLFVAVIFIALSWDFCRILINMSNDVGQGVAGIIGTAIRGEEGIIDLQLRDVFGGLESTIGTGAAVTGAIFAGIVASVAGPVLWPIIGYVLLLMLGAFLSLTLGLFLLALRQVLIFALILLAPLAILSWIFPENNKLWKFWWNSFSKLLLLFPIIVLLLVSGKAFAYIIFETGAREGIVNSAVGGVLDFTLKMVAYFAPYFLIPTVFKLAGSAFSNLAGMANDRSRGVFDRVRKGRQSMGKNAMKHGMHEARNAELFRGSSRMHKYNKAVQAGSLINKAFDGEVRKGSRLKDIGTNIGRAATGIAESGVEGILKDAAFMHRQANDDEAGTNLDVGMKNRQGLKHYLQKKGKWKKSEAELDSALDEVMALANNNDYGGALRKYYEIANDSSNVENTIFKGDASQVDAAVSAAVSNKKRFNDASLKRAYHEMAVKGGTYYTDERDAWEAAEMATGEDANAYANLSARVRSVGLNAGRGDTHGISFGASFGVRNIIKDLKYKRDNGIQDEVIDEDGNVTLHDVDEDYIRQKVHRFVAGKVIAQQAAGTLTHPSMKTEYVAENTISYLGDVTEEASERYLRIAGNPASTPEQISAAKDNYMQKLAQLDNMQQAVLSTKPEMAPVVQEKLLDRKVIFQTMVEDGVETVVINQETGETGERPTYGVRWVTGTAREAKEAYKMDKDYQRFHKEFNTPEDREYMQRMGGGRPPADPTAGPGGPTTPPI